jgi:hypothetical protein
MSLTGTVYVSTRATQSIWGMRRFSRPVWLHANKPNRHGQQEETI